MIICKTDFNELKKYISKQNRVEELPTRAVQIISQRSGYQQRRMHLDVNKMSQADFCKAQVAKFEDYNENPPLTPEKIIQFAQERLALITLPTEESPPENCEYVWYEDGSCAIVEANSPRDPNTEYRIRSLSEFLIKHVGCGTIDYPILCLNVIKKGRKLNDDRLSRDEVIAYARAFEQEHSRLARVIVDTNNNSLTGGGRKGAAWAKEFAKTLVAVAPEKSAKEHWQSISEEHPNREKDFFDLDERHFVCRRQDGEQEKLFVEDDDGSPLAKPISFRTWERHVNAAKRKLLQN